MSDTPISDSTPHNVAELGMLCRKLERDVNDGIDRIKRLLAERDTARMQAAQKVDLRKEFRHLLGTDDIEEGITVVCDLKQLAAVRLGYIKQLDEELERTKQDRNAIAKTVREPLLLKLDHANDRIKRLEEAGDVIKASLQRSLNSNEQGECKWLAELPMTDAEFAVFTTAFKAKETKP